MCMYMHIYLLAHMCANGKFPKNCDTVGSCNLANQSDTTGSPFDMLIRASS